MKQNEHLEQKALIDWWRLSHKKYKLPEFALFAIPNGGNRNIVTAVKLKSEGVRSGISDLFLAVPSNGYNGMFIEMKYGKNKATANQDLFLNFAENHGYMACVSNSWEDAKFKIELYLGTKHGT